MKARKRMALCVAAILLFAATPARAECILADVAISDSDIDLMAKTLYGECRRSTIPKCEKAAVAWCILNRLDAGDWGDTIEEVVTAPEQFRGYKAKHPVTDDLRALAVDVVDRWLREKAGETDVGRTLPREYLFFAGRADKRNHFRTHYDFHDENNKYWDWALPDPYAEAGDQHEQ